MSHIKANFSLWSGLLCVSPKVLTDVDVINLFEYLNMQHLALAQLIGKKEKILGARKDCELRNNCVHIKK
jgi:hypothetical protein